MSEYLDGRLLVAPPKMRDYRFAKSVIYVWKHDVSGAAGVIVNKPLVSPTFEAVCQEGRIEYMSGIHPKIYYGGPVMSNMVGVLHTLDFEIKSTNPVRNDLGFTLDRQAVEAIALGHPPANYFVTMGMSSWEPGQMEQEIAAEPPRRETEAWLVLDYDFEMVFNSSAKDMWEIALNQAVQQKTQQFTNRIFR
jgi:putative transcriptional regulator